MGMASGFSNMTTFPPNGKSCFFDETDCHTADSLIRDVFGRTDIKWPYTETDENEGKNFISGIQQIEAALR